VSVGVEIALVRLDVLNDCIERSKIRSTVERCRRTCLGHGCTSLRQVKQRAKHQARDRTRRNGSCSAANV